MVSEWLKQNKLSVMIREDFNHENVEDVVDVDTGEIIGKFYPDGYSKVHCFIDQRSIIGSNRINVLRAVARNFFAINRYKSKDDAYVLCKEYIALVNEENGYGIKQSEIDDAVSWAMNNRVDDYKELMATSYFTFNSRDLPYETIRKVVCRYVSNTKKIRSLLLMESAIQLQKEAVPFITKPSTAKVSREVDEHRVGVSLSTVNRHWSVFSEDVNAYHSSAFGTDNYAERRAASTIKTLMESYNNGNKTKMALHKDTGISRPTIDNYWNIIKQ